MRRGDVRKILGGSALIALLSCPQAWANGNEAQDLVAPYGHFPMAIGSASGPFTTHYLISETTGSAGATGASGSPGGLLSGGSIALSDLIGSPAGVQYLAPSGLSTPSAAPEDVSTLTANVTCTAANLRVKLGTEPGAGQS